MRLDAHQHFWIFDPVRDSWIDESMAAIRRDFLPEDLAEILEKYEFDGCVAVQADQTEEQNDFLLNQAGKNAFIKAIVGWVDLSANNIEDRLDYYQDYPLFKGFRHVLQGEAQRDLMLTPAFKNGISKLEKYKFTYDLLIFTDQINYAKKLAAQFPNQKFVLDHLAKPFIKSQEITDWRRDIKAIAQLENVSCKLSGMVTEADWKTWKASDFDSYLDVVFEAFGTKRLLFGSDWPVCIIAGGYGKALSILTRYTQQLSHTEQQDIFGNNAALFYNIK
ncbi:MAG: amidohydrolase family protein [Pedobacter sp.]|nr:amidohydrolase family protein [Pedobacter sp.]